MPKHTGLPIKVFLSLFIVITDATALHGQVVGIDVKDSPRSARLDRSPAESALSGVSNSGSAADSSRATPDVRRFNDYMNLFTHDFAGRFGRSFEYDFQRVEQPRVVQTASGAIVPNPEGYLNEHTLKFQFNELIPSSSTLLNAFSNACGLLKMEQMSNAECVDSSRMNRVAAGRAWWARSLSGITVAVDLSERPALQQGVLLVHPPFTSHYQVSGSFDYDPGQLFLGGSNWKVLASKKDSQEPPPPSIEACDFDPKASKATPGESTRNLTSIECLRDLASPRLLVQRGTSLRARGGIAILAAVIPSFSFKRVSQFDFLRNGGILVPTTFLESAQNQFTFRWDLKRAIPSPTSRSDAYSILDSRDKAQKDAVSTTRICVLVYGNSKSFIPVSNKFSAVSCWNFAKQNLAKEYRLDCLYAEKISTVSEHPVEGAPDPDAGGCWKASQVDNSASN